MRVARTINRQSNDEDDVGRAGYVPPVVDQERFCSLLGTVYSPQHALEATISTVVGGILSNIIYASLTTIVISDLYAFTFALSLIVGAGVLFHKSSAHRITRTPLKALIYKVFSGVAVLAAVLALVIRYDLKGYEKDMREKSQQYPAGTFTAPAYESSFGGALTVLITTIVAASFSFVSFVLLCDFYNKNFSKTAVDDAVIDPSNEHGDRGISELCMSQIRTVLFATLVISVANAFAFDINKAAFSANSSSSFICKHQMISLVAGLLGGFWVGNANFESVEENSEDAIGV